MTALREEYQISPFKLRASLLQLNPGCKRWILRREFIDLPEADNPPSDALEVTVQDIIPHEAGAPTDNADVLESIRAWASRTGADLAEFEVQLTELPARKMARHKPSLAFDPHLPDGAMFCFDLGAIQL
jgi:hypothetical protein